MPLQLVDSESSKDEDTRVLDSYLGDSLQLPLSGGSVDVVERTQLGSVSHTFSHIQLTLRVQLLLLEVGCSTLRAIESQVWMGAWRWGRRKVDCL